MSFLMDKIVGVTRHATHGVHQNEGTTGSQLETIVLDDDSDDERERKDRCC